MSGLLQPFSSSPPEQATSLGWQIVGQTDSNGQSSPLIPFNWFAHLGSSLQPRISIFEGQRTVPLGHMTGQS